MRTTTASRRRASCKVVGPPDLVVTQVTVRNAPLTVARGGSLTITAAVKNLGEGECRGVDD